MNFLPAKIIVNKIESNFFNENGIELYIQREDLIHPTISGNKWRKLKYNIEACKNGKFKGIVTFGGAFSNHIAATAAAGKEFNIPTIGFIRGEKEYANNLTLRLAEQNGMDLFFLCRKDYQLKTSKDFIEFINQAFPKSLIIPEGGANLNGIKGCSEITTEFPNFDTIVCACGTGSTIAGIIKSLKPNQKALGIPVLKNAEFLKNDIQSFLDLDEKTKKNWDANWEINCDYHLGGYAKNNPELNDFIRQFYQKHNIKLDPIYTGKMMYALVDLIKKGQLKNQKILAIHTGGHQGTKGYESKYKVNLYA